jgi:uncharacterized protein
MEPGESVSLPVNESVALQIDEQPVAVQASGTLRVDRTHQGVLVRGRVKAAVPLTCSRCLISFQSGVETPVEEEFSLDAGAREEGGELGSEDFVSWVGPDHAVDLADVVRQNLQMSVPMAPLHAEDCRGLCPVCGTNWNERRCEHYRPD